MMKQIVEVSGEGFESLLGQQIEVRCNVYIYAGTLVGVNDRCIKLDRMAIVYETGAFKLYFSCIQEQLTFAEDLL